MVILLVNIAFNLYMNWCRSYEVASCLAIQKYYIRLALLTSDEHLCVCRIYYSQ